jgi:hypothetical protein
MLNKLESFAVNRWWLFGLVIAVLFLVASPDVRQNLANNAHRVSCHVNELAFGTTSEWGAVDCEAWFYKR